MACKSCRIASGGKRRRCVACVFGRTIVFISHSLTALQMVVRVWTQHGEFHGVRHAPGQRMLTWEVISLGNIASYNMIANPRYANIKELLLEMEERVRYACLCLSGLAIILLYLAWLVQLRHDQAAIASSFGVRARDVEEELDAEYGDADEAPVPVGRVLAPPVRSQSYAVDGRGVELVRAPQRVLHRYAATENYSPDVSTPVSNPLGPRFTYVDSEGRMHTPPVVGHGGRAAV